MISVLLEAVRLWHDFFSDVRIACALFVFACFKMFLANAEMAKEDKTEVVRVSSTKCNRELRLKRRLFTASTVQVIETGQLIE